ncbi:TetR/AcrR family transcriptional regulator [Pseudomonas fildesensis]|uniref:TetR/AcrR family transcriptional regulator n=1 Tax=Pseudomonas fildesensis TaxID=1674920 RepID=UPI00387ABC26
MGRPREFDRDQALLYAIQLFWKKGYAATSTEDLLQVMGIKRQSLYNAFGDKRQLYLEALGTYLHNATSAHLMRLNTPSSPLEGIRNLLIGLSPQDQSPRPPGCMGVGSVGEFGTSDAQIGEMMAKVSRLLTERVALRIKEGQTCGEIDSTIDPNQAAGFVHMAVNGLLVAARAGAGSSELETLAGFAVDRLRK